MNASVRNLVTSALFGVSLVLGLGLSASPASATGRVDNFCQSSYGTTTWSGRNPWACGGTLLSYMDGRYLGKVNVTKLIASGTARREGSLNAWCGRNPFWCNVAVSGFFFAAGLVTFGNNVAPADAPTPSVS